MFADFRGPTLLTIGALKTAKNWDKAYYNDDLVRVLFPDNWGDQNKKLAEEQQREEQQKGPPPAAGSGFPAGEDPPLASGMPANSIQKKK
jgi:hypothetical protein